MNQITSVRTVAQLMECIQAGATPTYLLFWGHRTPKSGAVTKACFSQWFEAAFEFDGIHYPTAEHFMMAEKARVFGDAETLAKILAATAPDQVKALGRQVRGFKEEVWAEVRFSAVVTANRAKFSQNPVLRAFLLGTHPQVLVEASPVDSIWGIGLAADHADATQPERWQGLNLLGFALMEVRESLRKLATSEEE